MTQFTKMTDGEKIQNKLLMFVLSNDSWSDCLPAIKRLHPQSYYFGLIHIKKIIKKRFMLLL